MTITIQAQDRTDANTPSVRSRTSVRVAASGRLDVSPRRTAPARPEPPQATPPQHRSPTRVPQHAAPRRLLSPPTFEPQAAPSAPRYFVTSAALNSRNSGQTRSFIASRRCAHEESAQSNAFAGRGNSLIVAGQRCQPGFVNLWHLARARCQVHTSSASSIQNVSSVESATPPLAVAESMYRPFENVSEELPKTPPPPKTPPKPPRRNIGLA